MALPEIKEIGPGVRLGLQARSEPVPTCGIGTAQAIRVEASLSVMRAPVAAGHDEARNDPTPIQYKTALL